MTDSVAEAYVVLLFSPEIVLPSCDDDFCVQTALFCRIKMQNRRHVINIKMIKMKIICKCDLDSFFSSVFIAAVLFVV